MKWRRHDRYKNISIFFTNHTSVQQTFVFFSSPVSAPPSASASDAAHAVCDCCSVSGSTSAASESFWLPWIGNSLFLISKLHDFTSKTQCFTRHIYVGICDISPFLDTRYAYAVQHTESIVWKKPNPSRAIRESEPAKAALLNISLIVASWTPN